MCTNKMYSFIRYQKVFQDHFSLFDFMVELYKKTKNEELFK